MFKHPRKKRKINFFLFREEKRRYIVTNIFSKIFLLLVPNSLKNTLVEKFGYFFYLMWLLN